MNVKSDHARTHREHIGCGRVGEQRLDNRCATHDGGRVQRSEAALVGSVDVNAGHIEQRPHAAIETAVRAHQERALCREGAFEKECHKYISNKINRRRQRNCECASRILHLLFIIEAIGIGGFRFCSKQQGERLKSVAARSHQERGETLR